MQRLYPMTRHLARHAEPAVELSAWRVGRAIGLVIIVLFGSLIATVKPAPAQSANPFAPTYSIAALISLPATPTDVMCIEGSASGVTRVLRVQIDITAPAAATEIVSMVRRSTLNSGGTSTTPTSVKRDSNNAAALATVRAYSANATTLGTTVGTIEQAIAYVVAPAGVPQSLNWDWTREGQPPTLNGSTEAVCLNFGAVTITSGIVIARVVFQQG
jgi:hypothetical protein